MCMFNSAAQCFISTLLYCVNLLVQRDSKCDNRVDNFDLSRVLHCHLPPASTTCLKPRIHQIK
ncbi:hypothetical protein PR003_g29577 [Phytophthora rubi]|uniref:Uncharacterized protein n=1 Tax=Phytophthora rubi TaxID=129364 RepID=A0A6A3HVT9_9STRA|nr:hypothetical protein PR001_g28339 [Phytophthora rubi]KAE8971848.1 hypothetical protein PR002_g26697 [Phytophthora rubi]KAE9274543.1 hypothetical protein PR003_g29577 [Phytophthora rubi]